MKILQSKEERMRKVFHAIASEWSKFLLSGTNTLPFNEPVEAFEFWVFIIFWVLSLLIYNQRGLRPSETVIYISHVSVIFLPNLVMIHKPWLNWCLQSQVNWPKKWTFFKLIYPCRWCYSQKTTSIFQIKNWFYHI